MSGTSLSVPTYRYRTWSTVALALVDCGEWREWMRPDKMLGICGVGLGKGVADWTLGSPKLTCSHVHFLREVKNK